MDVANYGTTDTIKTFDSLQGDNYKGVTKVINCSVDERLCGLMHLDVWMAENMALSLESFSRASPLTEADSNLIQDPDRQHQQ